MQAPRPSRSPPKATPVLVFRHRLGRPPCWSPVQLRQPTNPFMVALAEHGAEAIRTNCANGGAYHWQRMVDHDEPLKPKPPGSPVPDPAKPGENP